MFKLYVLNPYWLKHTAFQRWGEVLLQIKHCFIVKKKEKKFFF